MSLDADTLRRLRVALVGCGLLLAIAAALAWTARDRAAAQQRLVAEQQRVRIDSVRRLETLRSDADLLATNAARFADLVDAGAIGEFPKTERVDGFERAAVRLARSERSSVVQYTLKPRMLVTAGAAAALSGHSVAMHPLSFDLVAVHERDLLRLWSGVAEGLGRLSSLEGCSIIRVEPRDGGGSGDRAIAWPTLHASCSAAWYAFEPKSDGAGAPAAPPFPVPDGGGRG